MDSIFNKFYNDVYMKKVFFLFIFAVRILYAQDIKSLEFHNQEITDILMVLAQNCGVSIICDDTVSGEASFYFSESSIEQALDNFLKTYNLYYEKENGVYRVSKVKIAYDSSSDRLSVKAAGINLETLIKKIARQTNKTILYDNLPGEELSLDINGLSLYEALQICVRKFEDYELIPEKNFFYVKYNEPKKKLSYKNNKEILIKKDGLYTLSVDKARLFDLIKLLFSLENLEYSNFIQMDSQIENLYFTNKTFDFILRTLLEHANADYIVKDKIYYLIEFQKKSSLIALKNFEIINLKWISVADFLTLLPLELSNSSVMKTDKLSNTVLLTGTKEEILPFENLIKKMDVPSELTKTRRFDLKYTDAKNIGSIIPQKFTQLHPTVIQDTNSILVSGPEGLISEFEKILNLLDARRESIPVCLKYIKTETLIKNLPPSITKDLIVDSGYPNLVFYRGSADNYECFFKELKMIDKPQPQIKYQLLVIQYTLGKTRKIKATHTVSPEIIEDEDKGSDQTFIFNGELSNIMGLSFDIISLFGHQFAFALNTQIEDSIANIYTDTVLTGLSGQEIKFQNTDTFRYIEYEYDSSKNTTIKTGTTQQITSGLIINMNGWVSGDNMITMNVNATFSKQNGDAGSSSTQSLPSTSERVVTTQIRTMSGEPIVISGLIKEDESDSISRIPVLGYIPILGRLFSHTAKSKEKTEIVIYIVPHLIQEYSALDTDSVNIERYYNSYLGSKYANRSK